VKAPDGVYMQQGGKRGVHTEHLGHLIAEMQVLPRAHQGARW
jgi:ring-1,2-phenylacetyl-CoA epoxidase subunit PaaC